MLHMTSKVDDELFEIIESTSTSLDAKHKGWELILGLTATTDGLSHVITSQKYIPFILSYIRQEEAIHECVHLAYKCLISISNQERGACAILDVEKDFISYLINNISSSSDFIETKCYILSNMSSHSSIVEDIAKCMCSSEGTLNNMKKSFFSLESCERKKYDFLALVFANLIRLPICRRIILEDKNFMDSICVCFNASESEVRRIGAALMLRNCCLEISHHEKLLNDFEILPTILLPLMGPEEYEEEEMDKLPQECQYLEDSKERDKSPFVRRILVQVLILLCYSENGWNILKSRGVYYVVRELHKWDKDSQVIEAIEHLVTYLLVETYSLKNPDGSKISEETLLEELKTDFLSDLPDFVV
ncbi:protein HGH1 homolog [Uloborus diversus]|uniref:protein HGH1 homolog n=1 Tax=Uloborus diversus TaxID=327109 RepID=UPI002409A983|nr:protein HGH1 homolog [Uloborus diversus]XP_054711680.1 protein HGH1 homolog [Uloborus diversus]